MITADAVRRVGPGVGLVPKNLENVVGRVVGSDVKRATAVNWKQIK